MAVRRIRYPSYGILMVLLFCAAFVSAADSLSSAAASLSAASVSGSSGASTLFAFSRRKSETFR